MVHPSTSGAAIVARSLMIQYSPIVIGPAVELSLQRGWMTELAPIVMRKVPVREAASEIVTVGWMRQGGLGAGGASEGRGRGRVDILGEVGRSFRGGGAWGA